MTCLAVAVEVLSSSQRDTYKCRTSSESGFVGGTPALDLALERFKSPYQLLLVSTSYAKSQSASIKTPPLRLAVVTNVDAV